MDDFLPQPFNRSRLRAGLHVTHIEREVLGRIKVLRHAPRVLRKLRADNPDAASDIPDFAAHAMAAHKEIMTALAEERSWAHALFDIDRAINSLNHLTPHRHLHGMAACARLTVRLRMQRDHLQRLDCLMAGAFAVR